MTFVNAGGNPTVALNSAIITYPVAGTAWGTIGWFGLWDAALGGNFRGSGAMNTPVAINGGDTARFTAGSLTITAE